MSKKKIIFYWIVTALLAFGMLSGGIAQLLQVEANKEGMLRLGYPLYFMSIIGTWKILGVITILVPKLKMFKEWAYAGFFFVLSGAILSHIASRDPFQELLAPLIFLALTIASWYSRPIGRKIV